MGKLQFCLKETQLLQRKPALCLNFKKNLEYKKKLIPLERKREFHNAPEK